MLTNFPTQKKSLTSKSQSWFKDCIDAAEEICNTSSRDLRRSHKEKQINYDLSNDKLEKSEIERVLNPFNLQEAHFPGSVQNYPLVNPKIDLLTGEEAKRVFDWNIVVQNPDAVISKAKERKKIITSAIIEQIQNSDFSPEEAKVKIQEALQESQSYREMREVMATSILQDQWEQQHLKLKFNQCFFDVLIAGEEIARVDIKDSNPRLTKCNPLNIFTLGGGESHFIEDSNIIVESGYENISAVIDEFYDELTSAQITQLEKAQGTTQSKILRHSSANPTFSLEDFTADTANEDIIFTNDVANRLFGGAYDGAGSVRVVRCLWKSMRKVGILSFFDDQGVLQEKFVDENYTIDEGMGEKIRWIWLPEWFEGIKVADDIYLRMRPYPVKTFDPDRPFNSLCPYTGVIYSTNSSRARSLMDIMKPYQYMYNTYMYRTELAFIQNKGNILELDITKKPDNWTTDKWMYYMDIMKVMVVNPFNEGKKGAATGKLSGHFNTTGKGINVDQSQMIQNYLAMIQFIRSQVGEISGVTDQRQGQIEQRELVGNVERSVTQSSHITEKWFLIHDNFKLRCLSLLLETSKYAYKFHNSQRIRNVLDELSQRVLDLDPELFSETAYGLHITNSMPAQQLKNILQTTAQQMVNADPSYIKEAIDIYTLDSVSNMKKVLKEANETREAKQQQAVQQEQKAAQAIEQQRQQTLRDIKAAEIEDREDEQVHEKELEELKAQTSIIVAQIKEGVERDKIASQERIAKTKNAISQSN